MKKIFLSILLVSASASFAAKVPTVENQQGFNLTKPVVSQNSLINNKVTIKHCVYYCISVVGLCKLSPNPAQCYQEFQSCVQDCLNGN